MKWARDRECRVVRDCISRGEIARGKEFPDLTWNIGDTLDTVRARVYACVTWVPCAENGLGLHGRRHEDDRPGKTNRNGGALFLLGSS